MSKEKQVIEINDEKEKTTIKIDGQLIKNVTGYKIRRNVDSLGAVEITLEITKSHESVNIISAT